MARVAQIRTPGQRRAQILSGIPDEQLVCMSFGRHDFPSDRISPRAKSLPRGISVQVQRDGAYQVTDTCTHCGKKRTWTSTPGSLFDRDSKYAYDKPEGWVTVSRYDRDDLGIGARDFREERFGRIEGLFRAAARPAAS